MAEVAQVLAGLAALRGEMERLSAEIPGVLPVRIVLPSVRPPTIQPPPRRETPPPWTPAEVLTRWRAEGPALLDALSRRHINAIIAATAHPEVGPLLAREAVFVQALVSITPPRRLVPALARMYFYAFPAHEHVHVALAEQLRGGGAGYMPTWTMGWTWRASAIEAARLGARWLADEIGAHGWEACSRKWSLPDALVGGPWAHPIVEAARVNPQAGDALARTTRLLRFADGGKELAAGYSIQPATVSAIRALVRLGHLQGHLRREIAALLTRRIGDPFRVAEDARWRGLEEEQRQVRTWLALQTIHILFTNLVPDNIPEDMTTPRRDFWERYADYVSFLGLLVDPRLRDRMRLPEVQSLINSGAVTQRWLEGGAQQAVVWLHLVGRGGQHVTCIEGNANTRWRVWPGHHMLPRGATVAYSEISAIEHRIAGAQSGPHLGHWQGRVEGILRNFYGIYP